MTGQKGVMRKVKSNTIQNMVQRILCFVQGHVCEPTGRHGIVIREMLCLRCGGLYAQHIEHGNCLLPVDADLDQVFRDREKAFQTLLAEQRDQ